MDLLGRQNTKMFLVILLGLDVISVIGIPGNHFIVGFMENVESKYSSQLVIGGNPRTPSNVTVTCPGLNFSQSFEVVQLETLFIEIPIEALNIGTHLKKKGILIESSADITVYGLNTASANSMDGFTALPTKYLGIEYRVISTNVSNLLPSDQRWSEFLIIGVFDNTEVEVQFVSPTIYQNVSYNVGDSLEIIMSSLETFQLQSQQDLTGARIFSNQPVAVMSGSKCANIPADIAACDHLVEFLPPTNRFGNEFILSTFLSRMAGDYFKLVGLEPNTTVKIVAPSISNVTIQLGAGDFYTLELHSLESGYVISSQPITVAQYSQGAFTDGGTTGDPSMLLVTPINHWLQGNSAQTVFSTFDVTADGLKPIQSYVTVTSRCEFTTDIMIDGRSFSVPKELVTIHWSFDDVINFCVLRFQLSPGTHIISAVNADATFAAYVYGFGKHIAYAYPLGSQETPLSSTPLINRPTTTYKPFQEHSTICSGANLVYWIVISFLIVTLCVMAVFIMAFWGKLKKITTVQPLQANKPRNINWRA